MSDLDSPQTNSTYNVSEEITTLIRGFFSTPVLAGIGRLGASEIMLRLREFSPDDFVQIPNKQLLVAALDYLTRIALLDKVDERKHTYCTTELGRHIFQRLGSFLTPHSYHEYLYHFDEQLLQAGPYHKQEVDRLENILGSGRAHDRYFPPAVTFLRRKVRFRVIADIGCGDGRFLDCVLRGVPDVSVVGMDVSEVSIHTAREKLTHRHPSRALTTFLADGAKINEWSGRLLQIARSDELVISMWFLLHEICCGDPIKAQQFLSSVHELFPQTPLIACELVRQTPALLSRYRKQSIMPEYVFFHDLSEQGILSWSQYQTILKKIPYTLAMERLYDQIGTVPCEKEPAVFVWCLLPK